MRLGVAPVVIPASLNTGSLETVEQKQRRILGWKPAGDLDALRAPYYDSLAAGVDGGDTAYPHGCNHMTCAMSVQTNGDVVLCADAFPPHGETFDSAGLICGNLLEPGASISRVWNSPTFRAGRELVLRHRRRPGGGGAPCHACLHHTA